MKYRQQRLHVFQGKAKSVGVSDSVELMQHSLLRVQAWVRGFDWREMVRGVQQRGIELAVAIRTYDYRQAAKNTLQFIRELPARIRSMTFSGTVALTERKLITFRQKIRSIGFTESMDDFEKRKLGIFNQLNFVQLVSGVIVPVAGLSGVEKLPVSTWIVAVSPAMVSASVLWLNSRRKYEGAMISYFIVYPFLSSVVYLSGMNLGTELFFILYGVLSVFFLQHLSHMLFSVSLSMISYFVLAVICKHFLYELETANYFFYLFNEILAIVLIYYGLYLVKQENNGYQLSILNKNRTLHKNNLEIRQQKSEIAEKADLLKKQTEELSELNSIKNKLFSIISHDLKSPMYALRNLFRNVKEYDVPAEEIKAMVPDVLNDLNNTTSLMENLLQWARNQMQADAIQMEKLDLPELIQEVVQLLRLQAEAKKITITSNTDKAAEVHADKDMVHLILRNLLSNAIKFTPENGRVTIDVRAHRSFAEIAVEDTGMGISREAMAKISKNDYYTTKGTASESGTGLGLMLCKEFLVKMNGRLSIESEPGKGSIFSFTLPTHAR